MRRRADNWSGPAGAGGYAPEAGFTLIELMVAVAIIAILAALALPNYVKIKSKAKEAETKTALHAIQLDLERWAVDNDGDYPPYLIGGETRYATALAGRTEDPSGYITSVSPSSSSDTLIRDGYVTAYPRNPFVRNFLPVHRLQADVGDPLRNASPMSQMFGTRFGAYCNTMGNALCDARWMSRIYTEPSGRQNHVDTYSGVQYEFYDIWQGRYRKPFLPGCFMYKSMGEIVPTKATGNLMTPIVIGDVDGMMREDTLDKTVYPINLNQYILSAWGGIDTKGLDLLGEEPLLTFTTVGSRRGSSGVSAIFNPVTGSEIKAPPTVDYYKLLGVPPWTRGVNRSHVGPLWGSPYGPGDSNQQMTYGNPNGIRDALIMVLTSGGNADQVAE